VSIWFLKKPQVLDLIYFANVVEPLSKEIFFFFKCQNFWIRVILLCANKVVTKYRVYDFLKGM